MEAIHNRNLTSSDISNHLWDEERIELRTIGLVNTIVFHLILEGLNSTNTNSVNHTDTVLVFCLKIHAAVLNSLLSSNQGQLCVAVHLTCLFAIQKIVHVEVLYLTSEFVVSKLVIGAAPLTPLSRLFHISSGVLPTGVTAPRPVTTTLFNSISLN